ncbi:MAG: PEP-CTERM sorting domain-containing protein [Nitrospirales bacterium]|nr:PEP-CTERM sorting domain-containing protein [Nitrospirales bacterium]
MTGTVDSLSTSRLVQNPEPSTILLFASGCAALAWCYRRRGRHAAFER